jgi:hypothetical protein
MTLALEMIERGFLPSELPPVFQSRELAQFAAHSGLSSLNVATANASWTRGAKHSLARPGGLRRVLTIPNPSNYLKLCEAIETAWTSDIDPILQKSFLASSRPIPSTGPRSFAAQVNDKRAELEVLSRSGSRFILSTDIQNFFPSIYTHSIPWVLHGKATAKANPKSKMLAGNVIDKAVRDGQDGQTMGLPIGPDSSWVIAETLLARVEEALRVVLPRVRGHRFSDDITIVTGSLTEAEQAMDVLQTCLGDYELTLNPRKTSISQLPVPIEERGISELRSWKFRDSARGQKTDLIEYFDRVAELIQSGQGDHVATYAIARLRTQALLPTSWTIAEALILQLLVAEPSCAKQAAMTLSMLKETGLQPSQGSIAHASNSLILRHAPLGHASEVSWALWLCLAAGATVDSDAASAVSRMDDSIVALLALHANAVGLIPTGLDTTRWQSFMDESELNEPAWLLSYEAKQQGWLSSNAVPDHRLAHPFFGALAGAGVSFYQASAMSLSFQPSQIVSGGGGGGLSPYAHIFSAAAS